MINHYSPAIQQPMIVKYVQPHRNGIQSHTLARHCIGFIVRGTKYIYNGDLRLEVAKGDMFYLNSGNHYTEDIPEDNKPFEQIVFYYTPDKLSSILANLSRSYDLTIANDHTCPNCHEKNHVIYPAWTAVRNFFNTINQSIKDGHLAQDKTVESLKMTELIYLIVSQKECCIKTKILENTDSNKENFEYIIHSNIFNPVPIEELARKCNRSLTSFKKEFKKHFFEPPHKWFIKQRLAHSRLLLISTGKSISEIGNECNFPNTSHFIKLFKKQFGYTPASYRSRHMEEKRHEVKSNPDKSQQSGDFPKSGNVNDVQNGIPVVVATSDQAFA